jgi:hypothetical protein
VLLVKGLEVCGECWSLKGQGVVGSHAGVPVGMCHSVVGHHVKPNAKGGIKEFFLGRIDVGEQGCRACGVIHWESVCWSWLAL